MLTIGFTGTRDGMTEAQEEAVKDLLLHLGATRLLHGACHGADRQAHRIAIGMFRDLYPARPEQLYWAEQHIAPGDTIHPLPASDVKPNPEIWRNHKIVDRADVMIAAPASPIEILRSGTWATIRYAKQTEVKCYRCLPDGTIRDGD